MKKEAKISIGKDHFYPKETQNHILQANEGLKEGG